MKDLQNKVATFCIQNKLECSPENRLLDLTSELGEFAKEILKATDYGKDSLSKNHHMEIELGDLIYSLICLANSLNIDMETALTLAIEKYTVRLKKKGNVGS